MNGKFLIIFLMIVNLFGVVAKVDKQNVILGDSVAFSITASGKKIVFPKIDNIDGDNIEAVSSSENISIINGTYKKTITKTYVFTPTHSLVIPSYEVMVDNKVEKTQPIKINVLKDDKKDKDFKLEIETKKEAIVGYPLIVTIKFYQKTNVRVDAVSLELPKGDFELKQIGKEKDYYEGIYQVAELKYQLIPKKAGDIDFKVKLKLGFRQQRVDNFGFIVTSLRYKTLIKDIKIKAKKVYDGLIGDFKIFMNVDKTKTKANQPINATLIIQGDGDLNSLGDIKLDIPNVTIYDDKPLIKQNKYIKKFVIVADNNFTIPPLSLTFYSLKEKKVKTISTKPINIEVINNQKCIPQIVTKTQTKIIYKQKIDWIYVIFSFILGIVLGYLSKYIKFKKFELPKNLYQKLLPFADNPKIKEILNKLYNKQPLSKEDKQFLKEFFNENQRGI